MFVFYGKALTQKDLLEMLERMENAPSPNTVVYEFNVIRDFIYVAGAKSAAFDSIKSALDSLK